jgi:hypothetical protein
MYMQQSLFVSGVDNAPQGRFPLPLTNEQCRAIDERRKVLEQSQYTRWYCIREILYAEYLWDMRCWLKPKFAYSKTEVLEHIKQWIKDHQEGNWTNNCGHCLYCIRKLLYMKWATPDEIATLILKNNNIKYPNEIGTWGNGFDE